MEDAWEIGYALRVLHLFCMCSLQVGGAEERLSISKQLVSILCAYNRKLLLSISAECDNVGITISKSNEVSI